MEELTRRFADRDVRSVFIYTREAHPGEHYRHHTSMDDKRANARAFIEHSDIRREILLDSLEGDAHIAYGSLPNMTWIVGRGGFIHYKSAWTAVRDVEDALENILDFQANRAKQQWIPFYSERSSWSTRDQDKFKDGLVRNGPQAVEDMQRQLAGRPRVAPAPDMAPNIPGSFYKAEEDGGD